MNSSSFEILETKNSTLALVHFVSVISYLDGITRIYAIFVYIIYFVIIACKKEFRQLTFTFVHNVNINGFLFVVHYGFYLFASNTSRPNTSSQIANEILCRISEIIWASTKYLNTYSVLLLAFSRYIAVCRIDLYKRVIKSKFYVTSSLIILWIFSILIAIFSKFVFKTKPGEILCFDGYSDNTKNSVFYFIFTAITAVILPNCFVLYLYARLLQRLKGLSKILGNKNSRRKLLNKWSHAIDHSKYSSTRHASENNYNNNANIQSKKNQRRKLSTIINDILKKNNEEKNTMFPNDNNNKRLDGSLILVNKKKTETNQKTQAKQLIILSGTICFTTITFLLLNAGNLLDENNINWLLLRLIFRIITIFSQSLIPIISIIFHPIMSKSIKSFIDCNNNTSSLNVNKIGIELTTIKV